MPWRRPRLTVQRLMVLIFFACLGLGWIAWQDRVQRDARSQEEAIIYGTSAIAEVRHNGQLAWVQASDATADETIQKVVDLIEKQGIDGSSVLRFFSWKQPSPRWIQYFKERWPKATVSWSGPDEDVELKAAIKH